MSHPLRPAKAEEAEFVHAQLRAALAETFPHAPDFIAHELLRFSPAYLRALIAANPAYVFIVERPGARAGFMLSGPEQGNLVYYWGYIDPAHRKGGLALACMAQFSRHWDNGRFHKISAYTTAENRVAQLLMQRSGYRQVALLERHVFGQDLILFEKPLTKLVEGYDPGVFLRLRTLVQQNIQHRLRRA
jgi:RimJ/RimL family protein N-acetyltransferase